MRTGLFGSGTAKLLQTELPKLGFEVLETIAHPTPARDMSNIALRIRSLNPDMIIPSDYYGESVLLCRTLQQQRIRPKAIYGILNGARLQLPLRPRIPRGGREHAGLLITGPTRATPRPRSCASRRRRWARSGPITSCSTTPASCWWQTRWTAPAAPTRREVTAALAASSFTGHIMPYGPTKFENGQNTGRQPRQHAGAARRQSR